MAQHFSSPERKNCHLRIMYSVKISFSKNSEIMVFSNEEKQREFIVSRPTGEGNDNPLQYSCLENLDRGAWQAIVHRVAMFPWCPLAPPHQAQTLARAAWS